MKSKTKVSVIVPIYNSENYLNRCLDSLVNQTLKNIEIILVNDGSKDNSLHICKEYSKNDNRIKIIDGENSGVSIARNKGLDIAEGEYVGFVDSDDYIDLNTFEEMYKIANEKNVDIVVCNFYRDNNSIFKTKLPKNKVLEGEELKKALMNSSTQMILPFSVKNLFKNDDKQKRVRFKPTLKYGEDTLYNLTSYLNDVRLFYSDKQFYHCMPNPNSAMSSKKQNFIDSLNELYLEKIKIFNSKGLYELKQDVYDYSIGHMLDLVIDDVYKYDDIKEMRKSLIRIRNSEMVNDGFKYSNIKNINDKGVHKFIKILLKYKFYDLIIVIYILLRFKNKGE